MSSFDKGNKVRVLKDVNSYWHGVYVNAGAKGVVVDTYWYGTAKVDFGKGHALDVDDKDLVKA